MLWTTLWLLVGVGLGTLVLGAGLAWLVTAYEFPGAGFFGWALVLPLAMPAYILGFVFLAVFDFAGPVQTFLRGVIGSDAWFPDVRSLPGAAIVLSLTLYPYVYVLGRAALRQQVPSSFETARTLGDGRLRAARRVVLPLIRPALAAGLAIVMMETLTDFATVQYFNVDTVSVGVYQVWRGMFNRAVAFELAALVLGVALIVIAAERVLRGGLRFYQRGPGRDFERGRLGGWRAAFATTACGVVLALAVGIPILQLGAWAVGSTAQVEATRIFETLGNSLGIAVASGVACVGLGLLVAGGARLSGSPLALRIRHLATVGYAVPGPVVAMGVLVLIGAATGLISGSPAVTVVVSLLGLVYAYTVRFTAVAYGSVDASMEAITPGVVDAAHTLGSGPGNVLRRVHLPLARTGAAAGMVLVMVDVLKELPIVLLIRPFGLTTTAVWVWELASESRWESAAIPALLIVAVALIPVLVYLRRGKLGEMAAYQTYQPEIETPTPAGVP
ncbi:MAG TPA: iron ABC transporter permease [Acidimicrobiia bacterium]|nr:iron ABC transporter permease [Acidimicrobiia bacterium]